MATITANVGAAGNWNSDSSWIGGVKPTAADDAVIPLATTSITIDAGSVCRSANFDTCTGTVTFGATGTLTIGDGTAGAGNVALNIPTGMTFAPNAASLITFVSTSTTQQTVSIGTYTMGNITFNGVAGSWILSTGITTATTSTTTLTAGTLNVNGQTCSFGLFNTNNSNTRVLTLGAAAITITGVSTAWDVSNATGLTLTAHTATITMTGTSATFRGGSGLTYDNVVMGGAGTQIIFSGPTFTDLTKTGTAAKTDIVSLTGDITVTGAFTVNSNSDVNRVLIQSNTVGTARTITAAAVVITNTVDFQDITGAGAATWTVAGTGATAIGDCGGLTGITPTPEATQTATGTASFTWSTHGWTSRVPLPQDDVVINNAFIAGRTITADMPRLGKNISFAGMTGTPALSNSVSNSIYGSLTLISAMTTSGTSGYRFVGRGSFTITSAGLNLGGTGGVTFDSATGTYTLSDPFLTTGNLAITSGNFIDGGFAITTLSLSMGGSLTRVVTLTGTITLTSTATATVWNMSGSNITLNATSSIIVVSAASANTRTFGAGGYTYGTLTYTVAGSTGQLNVTGSPSFAAIIASDASNTRVLKPTAATIITIRNLNGFPSGNSSFKTQVVSITGAACTFTSSNQQSCDNLDLTNVVVDSAPKWYAGVSSTDNGGNTNWIFTAPPSAMGDGNGTQSFQSLQSLRTLQ